MVDISVTGWFVLGICVIVFIAVIILWMRSAARDRRAELERDERIESNLATLPRPLIEQYEALVERYIRGGEAEEYLDFDLLQTTSLNPVDAAFAHVRDAYYDIGDVLKKKDFGTAHEGEFRDDAGTHLAFGQRKDDLQVERLLLTFAFALDQFEKAQQLRDASEAVSV